MSRRTGFVVAAALAAAAAPVAWLELPGTDVPDYPALRAAWRSSDALLLDRHGRVVHELRVDLDRRRLGWVSLDSVSPALLEAVVEAEDRRFFAHRGIDWAAVASAGIAMASRGETSRGASTISMQLAGRLRSALDPGSGRRSVWQKLLQLRAARQLERAFTKDQILESYLNLVYFRGELQGLAAAARGLFDKSPEGLTLDESAILAALVRAPNAGVERVAARACDLADRLRGAGEGACTRIGALARASLEDAHRLAQRVSLAPHAAHDLLRAGRGNVTTTLDADLQRVVVDELRASIQRLRQRGVGEGAALVVDNATAGVLAYVGNTGASPDTFYVDGVRAPRQAGSTLKPLLYGMAFGERRLTAASLLLDSPVSLETPTGAYVPQNYDRTFRGWVSARTALAGSINVPAVRSLMLVGVDAFADRLRDAGFGYVTEPGDYYGYSLALGSAEVTLWQLVQAYRALADGGRLAPLTLTPREAASQPGRPILDPSAAFVVADVLADRAARASSFGLDNTLALPFPASVKTGTSKDMRDNWCVGFTDRYTVGVWVGNFDGSPMRDVSGVTGAAPVWARIMRHLHRDTRVDGIRTPAGVVRETVRFDPPVEAPRAEWFIDGTAMRVVSPLPEATRPPRIVYPGDGMILALDADIPAGRQRVFFETAPRLRDPGWRLDGERLTDAQRGWTPTAGPHRLELVDGEGVVIDDARFVVRGLPAARVVNEKPSEKPIE